MGKPGDSLLMIGYRAIPVAPRWTAEKQSLGGDQGGTIPAMGSETPEVADCRIAAWLGEALCEPLGTTLCRSPIDLAAVAGAGPGSAAFAEANGLEHLADPRALLQLDVDTLLIADPTLDVGAESLAALMREAAHKGTRICTLTPRPASYSEAGDLLQAGPLPRPIPLTRDLAEGRNLLGAMESFGRIDTIQVGLDTSRPLGTCLDRLYDAFDLLHGLMGEPRSVHAAEPIRPSGTTDGESRNIMIIARYPDGQVAGISTSDGGGVFSRSITAWGEGGRLHWRNGRVDWVDPNGKTVEQDDQPQVASPGLPDQLIDAVARISTLPAPTQTESRQVETLACVEASLLALRTGETESVDRIRSVLGRLSQ